MMAGCCCVVVVVDATWSDDNSKLEGVVHDGRERERRVVPLIIPFFAHYCRYIHA